MACGCGQIIIGRVGGCGQNGRALSRIFLLAGWQLCKYAFPEYYIPIYLSCPLFPGGGLTSMITNLDEDGYTDTGTIINIYNYYCYLESCIIMCLAH